MAALGPQSSLALRGQAPCCHRGAILVREPILATSNSWETRTEAWASCPMLSCRGGQRSGQLRTRVGAGRPVFLYKQATGLSPLLNQHEAPAVKEWPRGKLALLETILPSPHLLDAPKWDPINSQLRQVVRPCTYRRSLWWEAPLLSADEEGLCLRREDPHRS